VKNLKSNGFLDNYSMNAKREQIIEESSDHKSVYFNYARDLLIRKDLDLYLIILSTIFLNYNL
jgi:hypothetical protein